MATRREFASLVATGLGLGLVQACSPGARDDNYVQAVRGTWRHTSRQGGASDALRRELVRYATLAPSSHNTQCWKFRIEDLVISILPDLSRRCPAVDPDDHHLFVSLGCAAENLVHASLANGLHSVVNYDSAQDGAVRMTLDPTKAVSTPLFSAIPERQSTRAEFDGRPITSEELRLLETAGTADGVRMHLFTEPSAREKVLEYVVQANTQQMNDAAFVRELKSWIRFNSGDAIRSGDGLYSATSGNPSLPSWIGRKAFSMFFTTKSENDKYAKQVRSSAGIAVFVADAAEKSDWVNVGRCYERFALQSAALGIRNAFLNQPVEVTAVRPQFAAFLGIGDRRPDLVVRFGRGPTMPYSLRRPLTTVIL